MSFVPPSSRPSGRFALDRGWAGIRQFVKPRKPTPEEVVPMSLPVSLWYFVRSGPTGVFWPLGVIVIALSIQPLRILNLVAGFIVASIGVGAYAGLARAIRMLRGTVGLDVFHDYLRTLNYRPRTARFMVRAFLPLSVMSMAAFLTVVFWLYGGVPDGDEPSIGFLQLICVVIAVACAAAFALALPLVFTMGFFGRPRFLMPKDYRVRGEEKLRLIAAKPDSWTAEDYASPDLDLTPDELARFKVEQQAAERDYAEAVRRSELGLPREGHPS